MLHITWKYFSFFKNKPPASCVAHITRGFFICYSCSYYSSMFKGNYIPEENIAIDEYLSLWKGRLSFRIYISTKRERYGVKLFMLRESNTGYLRNFIIYTGAITNNTTPLVNPPMPFDNYKSPSKVVLSLMTDFIQCGYCLTLDNYYISPEISETLLSLETDFYDFWNWKPKKGDPPTKDFKGDIMVLWWNDVTKTKPVKIVSMLSTIHLGELIDRGKKLYNKGSNF